MKPTGKAVRVERRHEPTGALVRVLDLCHPDNAAIGPGMLVVSRDISGLPVKTRLLRWGLTCVDHGTVIEQERLDDATVEVDDPRAWCDGCAGRPA